jgi:type IX secretion system PorP/SprF family membrane protein
MKITIKVLLLLLIPVSAFGQLTPVTDHYILNPLSLNPACAGASGSLNVAAFYRHQWVGINGAPVTMTLTADAPLRDNRIGLGVVLLNDKIGVTKETQLITNYSYKLSIGKGSLSFGLGAGLISTNTAWSDLTTTDSGDEYYLIDSKPFYVPHASFGTYFIYENYFAGLSVPKIFSYKYNFDKGKYQLANDMSLFNYMVFTGYTFTLTNDIRLLPSTLLSFRQNEPLLIDINIQGIYADKFWMGFSYRSNNSFNALFQVRVTSQIKLAYSYDYVTSEIGNYSNGSHEIMIRYEFGHKFNAVSPLNF